MSRRSLKAFLLFLIAGFMIAPPSPRAQIYSTAELQKDEVRLRNAVIKIYEIGLRPSLTKDEQQAIGDFEFRFPYPKTESDDLMNFAASTDGRILYMPVMSLKALEDLTTAYAWLYHQNYNLSTIDLYFTMLRYRDAKDFPGGKHPSILRALGVPQDALKNSKVDELSLSLRNEAIAFSIMHELGHIRFRHKRLDEITPVQAQKDESEADRFALDVLGRTGTPALGAVLFFQAQIYLLKHRWEFDSEQAFHKYATSKMTHPLSVGRIEAMASYMEGPLARSRPKEGAIWASVGMQLRNAVRIMEDDELARCIVRVAKQGDLSILQPRQQVEAAQMLALCKT